MRSLSFRLAGAAVAVTFLTQATGAADLAIALSAARGPAAFPPPAAVFFPPKAAAAPAPTEAPAAEPAKSAGPSAWSVWLSEAKIDYAAASQEWQELLAPPPPELIRPIDLARVDTAAAPPVAPPVAPIAQMIDLPVDRPSIPAVPEITPLVAAAAPPVAAPAPEPKDRMLVVPDPDIMNVGQPPAQAAPGEAVTRFQAGMALSHALPTRQQAEPMSNRVLMPWFKEKGFRMRIVYLDSYGVTRGQWDGFDVRMGDYYFNFVPAVVPPELRRTAPLYFYGMTAPYRIELESTSSKPLSLGVFAREEEMDGSEITKTGLLGIVFLPAGGHTFISASTPLLGRTENAINFERTHVVVTAGGSRAPSAVLANEPAAGVIDPPRL